MHKLFNEAPSKSLLKLRFNEAANNGFSKSMCQLGKSLVRMNDSLRWPSAERCLRFAQTNFSSIKFAGQILETSGNKDVARTNKRINPEWTFFGPCLQMGIG